jgi:hypothetical protein
MATSTILRQPVLAGSGWVADLSRRIQGGRASQQWLGGFWQFSFTLTARADKLDEVSQLQAAFQDWLGYHVERVRDNTVVWDGFIAQMDFSYGRVRRRRSLVDGQRPVFNAIRAKYTADSTSQSDELMENGGLETANETDGHTFETFGDVTGDGSIARVATPNHSGNYAGRVIAGASANTKFGKTIRVKPETQYRLSFWARGDGANGGRYEVWDVTAGAAIVGVTVTGVTGGTFTLVNVDFTTPAGCSGAQLWFMCPAASGGIAYYDDISLKAYEPTEFKSAWFTDAASITRYGRIETTLETAEYTQAQAENLAQMRLAAQAWPQPYAIAISKQVMEPTLEVLACGYWITAAWKESNVNLVGATAISTVVSNLISLDCPFLSVGNVAANAFTATELSGDTAAARVEGLLALGDAALTSYRAWVGPGRKFYYQPVDYAVDYRLMRDGLRQRLAGPLLAPDMVGPGVIRDEGWPGAWTLPAGNFADGRDMLVTEVMVSQGAEELGDLPELRTAEVDEADIYAAQIAQEMENR